MYCEQSERDHMIRAMCVQYSHVMLVCASSGLDAQFCERLFLCPLRGQSSLLQLLK